MAVSASLPYLTYCIIGMTILITWLGLRDRKLFENWKFMVGPILQGREYHRLLSSGFLHANLPHIVFNLYCFNSFGGFIERIYGAPFLGLVYFVSLLGGSLLSLAMNRRRPAYAAIGASGAVSGVIFASIFLLPGGAIRILFIPINIPSSVFGLLYIVISIFGIERRRGRIGHEAHLGGALSGMALALIFHPAAILHSLWLFVAIVLLMTGYLIYANLTRD